MKTLSFAARLLCAAGAAATVLVLFNAIVSIAEPQRSVLIAKTQRLERQATAPTALALAPTTEAKTRK